MGCSYSSEELDYWDGCTNPMGEDCDDCGEWECEHNQHGMFIEDEVGDLYNDWKAHEEPDEVKTSTERK